MKAHRKIQPMKLLWCLTVVAATQLSVLGGTLADRWSFDETSGTTALDPVGGKNATLMGGASFTGSGSVSMGNPTWVNSSDVIAQYVAFPAGIVTGYTAITIEAWVTPTFDDVAFADWNRLWDFGNGPGTSYMFFAAGSDLYPAKADILSGGDNFVWGNGFLLPGVENHVVYTLDSATGKARIYINGVLAPGAYSDAITVTPASLGVTTNNYLFRSEFATDRMLDGSVNEFRIWNGALNQLQVAANYQNGPDTTNASYGTPTALSLQMVSPTVVGSVQQAAVIATTSGLTNNTIDVHDQCGVVYSSSSPSLATVNTNGQITAVAAGTVTITATLGSASDSKTLVVAPPSANLIHRYSFTDASDSVGTANASVQGGATLSGGQLVLDGVAADTSFASLPSYLIARTNLSQNALTIESWATIYPGSVTWARLFDFGASSSGQGDNYIFFTPVGGSGDTRLVVSDANPGWLSEQIVSIPGTLAGQTNVHIVCVMNPNLSRHVMVVYLNGTLAGWLNNLTKNLDGITDLYNWLGRDLYSADNAWLAGSIDEFRIYDGEMSAAQVAASYQNSGPNSTNINPGNLVSVNTLDAGGSILYLDSPRLLKLWATYQSATNVNVIAEPGVALSYSDTNVATMDNTGKLVAHHLGTSTITSVFQGHTNSLTVTVVAPQVRLAHRYSFSEISGTNAQDSIGTANATLFGGATLTGTGMVALDGSSGYIELPAGSISSLGDNITVEVWVTNNSSAAWSRVFDFGSPGDFAFLAANEGSSPGLLRFDTSSGGAFNTVQLPTNAESHVVLVYNYTTKVATLYLNGASVGSGGAPKPLSAMVDTNNWFGKSEFSDPYYSGAFDEIRIYAGLLTSAEIARDYSLGPNQLLRVSAAQTAASNHVAISWPDYAVYTLESSPTLGPSATWTPVGVPQWANGTYQKTVSVTGSAQFFRLHR
jgi:hypothetical protein